MIESDWDPASIFVSEENPELPYNESRKRTGRSYHFGQLKVLINEILFIVNHWYVEEAQGIHLVVAGAVTGEHYECLPHLFPMIMQIDLWDPKGDLSLIQPGKRSHSNKITFYQEELTPEKAEAMYKNRSGVFFVSDLRTYGLRSSEYEYRVRIGKSTLARVNNKEMHRLLKDNSLRTSDEQRMIINDNLCNEYVEMELSPTQLDSIPSPFAEPLTNDELEAAANDYDEKVWDGDSRLQEELVMAMEPVHAMLKFRLPFYRPETSLPETVRYFDGYLYKQAFAGTNSAECRLVPQLRQNGAFKPVYREYSKKHFERKLFYYNVHLRDDPPGRKTIWRNPVNKSTKVDDGERLINSYDTCYLMHVLDKYLYFMNYLDNNHSNRYTAVMAVWNWILETIEHYSFKGGVDFKRMRYMAMETTKKAEPVKQERPVRRPAIPSAEELLVTRSKKSDLVIPDDDQSASPPTRIRPVIDAFSQLSFKSTDVDEDLLSTFS
jgi:hypothetical protein